MDINRRSVLKTLGLASVSGSAGYLVGAIDSPGCLPETVSQDERWPPRFTANDSLFHGEVTGPGDAPVVIVVHGGPGADYRSLRPLTRLSPRFRVVLYDQRGTGLSPRVPPDQLSFEQYLEDLDAIVTMFGRDSGATVLLGHSFGGQLVAQYVSRHPEKVESAILAEPGPLNQELAAIGPTRGFTLDSILPGTIARTEARNLDCPDEHAGDDYFIEQMMARANPGYWCEDTPPGNALWRAGYAANRQVTKSMDRSDGTLKDLVSDIDRFQGRILFLASECNSILGAEYQREQMNYVPESTLAVVPDAGHHLFHDNPERALETVTSHLEPTLDGK